MFDGEFFGVVVLVMAIAVAASLFRVLRRVRARRDLYARTILQGEGPGSYHHHSRVASKWCA